MTTEALYVISAGQMGRLLDGWQTTGPAYTAIAQRVRTLIRDGRLVPDTRIPPERLLAEELGVSRTTVTKAYDLLRGEGRVHSVRGFGTVVSLPPTAEPTADPAAAGRTAARPAGGAARAGRAGRTDTGLARWAAGADGAPAGGWAADFGGITLSAPQQLIERTVGEAAGDLARALAGREQDPRGLPELRRALAERYTARGLPTTPAQLLLTHGVRHAWNLLLRLRVRPGQPVLLESPCQPGALDAVRLHGGRPWPAPVTEDGWPLAAMAAVLRRARAQLALLSPDFQQPSGQLMPAEAREFLVHTARSAGTVLVADQSWDELALDVPGLPPSLASWGAPEGVVLIGSARAVLGNGLQVGWIRAAPAIVHRLALSSTAHGAGSAVADQVITLRLLPHWDALRAQRQAELNARRAVLAAELADRLPDWRFTPPPGGPALWVDLGAPVSTALAGLAEKHAVRLLSGPRHGLGGAFDNRLRLPYTLPEPALRAGVHRLAEAAAELGPVSGSPGAALGTAR